LYFGLLGFLFFGPGLKVQITQPQEEQIDVALIAEG
jgi:hypothetical protein